MAWFQMQLRETYCCSNCARNQSRFARSRFQGRTESFAATKSKAELFEDGEKLRGEAVDDEEDAVAKRPSQARLGAVEAEEKLDAAERLDTT